MRIKNLIGIITNRDIKFETDMSKKIEEAMTKDNLVTAKEGVNLEASPSRYLKNTR